MTNNAISLGIWSSRALLLFCAIIYSTNFACVRYLETSGNKVHDPAETSFCRFFVSAIVCIPILYQNRRYVGILKAGVEVGFWCSVHYICQANSLEYIAAGKCSFICALEVVTVPLLSAFFLKKPIRPMSLISAAIAIFGVGILEKVIPLGGFLATSAAAATTTAITNPGPTIFGIGKGDMLALVQPLAFGYAMMRIEYHVERYKNIPNCVLTLTAAQCTTVFVSTFLWVLYDNGGTFPALGYMVETNRIIILFWTGVVTTVIAIILQGIALQKASATDAALIFSSDPVWSSLFAGWLLNERPNATTYVGGVFILTGCLIGSIASAHDSATAHPGGAHPGGAHPGGHHHTNNNKHKHEIALASPISPGSSTNNNNQKRILKHKDSNLFESDEESLLPELPMKNNTIYDSSISVQSMNDVRQFPVSTTNTTRII